jgi:hypothetical protein
VSTFVPTWSDVKAAWSAGWKALSDGANTTHARAAEADPTGTLARVSSFLDALSDSRASLDRVATRLPNPATTPQDVAFVAQHRALEARYHDLAAGVFSDAAVATTPVVGVAPVIVIGGLAIGAVGVAWAIAAYEYAMNLREQTALAERELEERVVASKEGRALAPSTLPPPAPGVTDDKAVWVLGGLAAAAALFALPVLVGR